MDQAAEPSAPSAGLRLSHGLRVLAAAIVLAGVAARIAGCFTDFWLDEVWTWELAAGMGSALDVLTRIHHSNNHHLNTLFVYLVGPDVPHWAVYRLVSLLAGFGCMALLAWIASRKGRLQGWLAAVLGASSYLLVFHGSEARGYALVVFFALLAYLQLAPMLERPSWWRGALFGGTVLLGLLSHLQFVHVIAAALTWSLWRFAHRRAGLSVRARDLLRCHVFALGMLVAVYWVDVRHMHIGGGPPYVLTEVLGSTARLVLGVPDIGPLALVALVAVVALALVGLVRLARRGDDAWVFHLTAILLSPALLLAVLRPQVLFERYFVISHAFLLLLMVDLVAAALQAGGARRLLGGTFLALLVAGNAALVARYLRDGSGRYLEALEFIADQTEGPIARVASDNDFRNARLIAFYQRWLPPGERIEYVRQQEWPDAIEWVLVHSPKEAAPKDMTLWIEEQRYDFVRRFAHGSHSGWDWFLFRRVG